MPKNEIDVKKFDTHNLIEKLSALIREKVGQSIRLRHRTLRTKGLKLEVSELTIDVGPDKCGDNDRK